jgi:quercetin dioxygenase-like cupin family protein
MQLRTVFWSVASAAAAIVTALGLISCGTAVPRSSADAVLSRDGAVGAAPRSSALILAAEEGERRVRRLLGGAPLIMKVDHRNGGAPDLVMGYEEIPPGQVIPPHRHLLADEIILVRHGSGVAQVGDREGAVAAGATIYIPRDMRVTVRNTGSESLSIAFVFSKPGFEDYLRDTSVPEGQPVVPLSGEELARVREKHRSHTVYEQP